MTKEEIELVKVSWRTLRQVHPHVVGELFYAKLFFDAPNLKPLFHQPAHSRSETLIGMLNTIIARLDCAESLIRDVRQLALRHNSYGVRPAQYDSVGNALLWTLEKAFGGRWNETLAKAWLKCFTSLATVMLAATEEAAVL